MLYLIFYLYVSFSELITFFLAHPSRMLMGGLIVYPCSVACGPSDIFCTETALPIKARSCTWVRGTKVSLRHLGHMTKLAATSIYGRKPSNIFFSETGGPI